MGKVTTQTTPQKSSITQRLRTDLGRSVGVTTVTQLVWLTWFTGPTFPLPAKDVYRLAVYKKSIEFQNDSANQRSGRPPWFSDRSKTHRLSRGQ